MGHTQSNPIMLAVSVLVLFAALFPAPAAGSSDQPAWEVIISGVAPVPPNCALRFSPNLADRLVELTGSNFPTGADIRHLQFRKATTGEQSIHFGMEVNWVSTTYISVDMALIHHLLWPDARLVLQVRLTGDAYLPVSDWSSNFILADDQAACDQLPPPAIPSDFKVLVVNFNPIMEAHGGVRLTELMNWGDPVALSNQYVSDLNAASHGYVAYDIVSTLLVDDFPRLLDGFDYTDATYLACLANPATCHTPYTVDYGRIFQDFDICTQVMQDGIDEVWLWGGPYFGYWEYNVRGPSLNILPENIPLCGDKTLYVMGFSYGRGNSEMLEDFGHRSEGVLIVQIAHGDWQQNEANEWNKFTLVASPISSYPYGHCGNIHYPPNGLSDYDWGNLRTVQSDCDDWYNYPQLSGAFVPLNCTAWGCNGYNYIQWWLHHLPHAGGTTGGQRNDWWRYVVDYDYALCPMHDPDCDRVVSVADIQTVAGVWGCARGDPCYQVHLDLDGDLLIDVADIVAVAERWGCVQGSSCYGDIWRPIQVFTSPPQDPAGSPG